MQRFSFIPHIASEKKIFDFFFFFFFFVIENLAFRLPIKISGLDTIHMVGRGILQKHFSNLFCQNICSNTEINANFHFSHYKYMYMETLSCHSNESTWATTIKKYNLCRD